jgi:peptidoglycan hydrolase-like protein with peptidoglycan-binding domain
VSSDLTEDPTAQRTGQGAERSGTRRRPRQFLLGLAATTVVAGAAAVCVNAAVATDDSGDDSHPFHGATEEVLRGDLAGSTTVSGTLRFTPGQAVLSGGAGTVTDLPSPGSVVAPGQPLYSVDNQPVFLLRGKLPAWRELAPGMDEGPDVQQLEESLHRLGFFDLEPDEYFTWSTAEAIEDWQEDNDVETTGRLPLGSVVFARHSLRVGTIAAHPGDQVGTGSTLFDTTSTTQAVEMDVGLADQQLAVIGKPVRLQLPGGKETRGRITSVGTPTQRTGADGKEKTVIPVVVRLRHPAAAAAFQEASVSVELPSQRRKDVLSVPVGALIALDPEQFGVEVVDEHGVTRKLPVTTGLFAAGRVEISGAGIEAGLRVVVPQR